MHPLCLLIAALPFQPALAGEVADEVLALAPLRAHRMAVDPPSIPVAAYDRAAEGKRVAGVQFVEGVAAGQGWGVAVYDLPIEAVWWAVNSEDVHEDWLRVEVSQVVDGEAYRDGRAVFQYLPLPVVKDPGAEQRRHPPSERRADAGEGDGGRHRPGAHRRHPPRPARGTRKGRRVDPGVVVPHRSRRRAHGGRVLRVVRPRGDDSPRWSPPGSDPPRPTDGPLCRSNLDRAPF
ncbi:MAG: hypothetical protein JRI25_21260 [Deltaproteobacteria bacterium]|nr:hypothetical protein [Deltaproteobacteria bacterium]